MCTDPVFLIAVEYFIHGNMKVWRRKWFKDEYQATEIVDDNASVGQMTSPNGLG